MEICAVQRLEGSNSLVMPLNSFVSRLKADYFLNIYLVETTVWKSVSKWFKPICWGLLVFGSKGEKRPKENLNIWWSLWEKRQMLRREKFCGAVEWERQSYSPGKTAKKTGLIGIKRIRIKIRWRLVVFGGTEENIWWSLVFVEQMFRIRSEHFLELAAVSKKVEARRPPCAASTAGRRPMRGSKEF